MAFTSYVVFRSLAPLLQVSAVGVQSLAPQPYLYGPPLAISPVNSAYLAYAGIITPAAIIAQLQISPFYLPTRQKRVLAGRALALDSFRAMAHLPAWVFILPVIDRMPLLFLDSP
jgi:hypothetical protein